MKKGAKKIDNNQVAHKITRKVFDLFDWTIREHGRLSEAYVRRIVLGIIENEERKINEE